VREPQRAAARGYFGADAYLTLASLRQNLTDLGDDFAGMREALLDLPQ